LAAFSEALVPEGGPVPAADGVAVAEAVASHVIAASPRSRAGIRLALLVLEWSSFPRRFSRLRADARAARVRRLERARAGLPRALFTLLKALALLGYARDPAVQHAVGIEQRCELAPGGTPPATARLDPAALEPPDEEERCDVVIVGSGAGGAAAARVLAERGLDVIVVEEGPYRDARTYSRDPLRAMRELYRDGGLTACEGRPVIPLPVGRCVGGTTVINSGTCFRAPDDVLQRWRDELGVSLAGELGAEAIGAANGPLMRNAGGVACCGTCPTGCELDAKRAAHVSELPRAVAHGARVRAGARVERLLVEGGRAVGVSCRVRGRRRAYEVRARAVVLAAGALGTPELLLRQGLRHRSLGRHLHIHPACWVGARFDEPVRGWEGVMQSWHVGEWHSQGLFLEATFTPLAFGAHWLLGSGPELAERIARYGELAIIGVHLSDRSEGRISLLRGRARVRYQLTSDDARRLRFGIARAADIHFAAGAREVYPQLGRVGALSPGEQGTKVEHARIPPRELRLEAFHPMGTARMGGDPRTAVVAPDGSLHDLPGAYVADASVFPTSLRVNPMLTIMACARRIAAGLADSLH
jgi:choline dehydrogenase-like flavoprotein